MTENKPSLAPLPQVMIEPQVRQALIEDLGRAGDITSDAIVPADALWSAQLVARRAGVIAGLDLAALAFRLMDSAVTFDILCPDGTVVAGGDVIARVRGRARALLGAERVALNYLGHLSGIATATRRLIDAARPHAAHIVCTRKTTPGLRALEKYAVRAGGGMNHRLGLDDAILIKDNHIAIAGSARTAVMAARRAAGHLVKVEVEVDHLDQLQSILDCPVDAVLLDNMTPADLARAVDMVGGRFITEASGGVTVETIQAIAATGVSVISAGWLTHSAPCLDIGLDDAPQD